MPGVDGLTVAVAEPNEIYLAQEIIFPEKLLLIITGTVVHLTVTVIGSGNAQAVTETFVNIRHIILEREALRVTHLECGVERVVATGKVFLGAAHSQVDTVKAVLFFYPPLVEVTVGQLKDRVGKSVPAFPYFKNKIGFIASPVFHISGHIQEKRGVEQLFTPFLQRGGKVFQVNGISRHRAYFTLYNGGTGFLIPRNNDITHNQIAAILNGHRLSFGSSR